MMKTPPLKRLFICSLMILVSPFASAMKPVNQRFGVAYIDGQSGYVAFNDLAVSKGEPILLITVSVGVTPRVLTAEILERVPSCEALEKANLKSPYYSIRVPKAAQDGPTVATVVRDGDSFKVKKDQYISLVSSDGNLTSFRHCTSSEGLHLTAWSGVPQKEKRIWHEYYYLGYDTEPDCNESDY